MNIFATDEDPVVSAENLDDLRVNKMVLETAQILSTACAVYGVSSNKLYKPTHVNHPSSKWARESRKNFIWLCCHGIALAEVFSEYISKDSRKQHASLSIILQALKHKHEIPQAAKTEFVLAANNLDLYPHWRNIPVVDAYKHYLTVKWDSDKTPPKWNGRKPPLWYTIGF